MPPTPEIKTKECESSQNSTITKFESENKTKYPQLISIPEQCSYYSMKHNITSNYNTYLTNSLLSISKIPQKNLFKKINKIKHILPKQCFNYLSNRTPTSNKLILLDLDETLIHSDFDNKDTHHDSVITITDEDNKTPIEINIHIRPNVEVFLKHLALYFDLAVFTSSVEDYANAVINELDKNNNIFKFVLHRKHCFNYGDMFYVKDLRILEDYISLEQVVLVDNNIFSFCNQIDNGILINSFFGDKTDNHLIEVYIYLINDIFGVNNVKEVNERMFHFKSMIEQLKRS